MFGELGVPEQLLTEIGIEVKTMKKESSSSSARDIQIAPPILKRALAGWIWMLLLAASLTAQAQQVVGYWKFDEGSGNIAHDSSGKENNGEIVTPSGLTVYRARPWHFEITPRVIPRASRRHNTFESSTTRT